MTEEFLTLLNTPFIAIDDEACLNRHILRVRAKPVPTPLSDEHKTIALALRQRMINQADCLGLAAPQLGLSWRIIVMHITPKVKIFRNDVITLIEPTILINPSFELLDNVQQINWEGTYSVKKQMGKISRYQNIRYRGWGIDGQPIIGEASGLLARVIQHEIDYLNGRLFIDLFESHLPHGPIDEMSIIRAKEFEEYNKMQAEKLPYVVIDDESCANRHILRDRAQQVPLPLSDAHKTIALALQQRMMNENKCVGLAAPQVGIPLRIIAVQIAEKLKAYRTDVDTLTDPIILINPSFESLDNYQQINWEQCFSVGKQMGKISRHQNIRYHGWDIDGQPITGEASGLLARVIQHEIDHLNGQLIIDLFKDNLLHGSIDEMLVIRAKEFEEYNKMQAKKLPYIAIDDENCANRHILKQSSELVPLPLSPEHKLIAINLKEQMVNQENCVGLAAPQVGIPLCIIAIQIAADVQEVRPDSDIVIAPMVLINPSYKALGDEQHADWEGCFSVNNTMGQIRRYKSVEYTGWDLDGKQITGHAHNFFARVMQHEIDHINGRIITDLFTNDLPHGPVETMREMRRAGLKQS